LGFGFCGRKNKNQDWIFSPVYGKIKTMETIVSKQKLPIYFKPILWSYNFEKIDPERNSREVIVNTLNYGHLGHWFWIKKRYGKNVIDNIVGSRTGEIRVGAKKLAEIFFKNYE